MLYRFCALPHFAQSKNVELNINIKLNYMRMKLIGSLKSVFLFALITLTPMQILAQETASPPPPPTNIGDLGPLLETNEKEEAINEYGPAFVEMVQESGVYAPAFDFFTTSMLWTVIAAALVFIMHLGFACLESGLCQAKNTVNILFKNVFIISIGVLTYALWGFNTHYPGDSWIIGGWLALGGSIGDLNADGGSTFSYGGLDLAMTGYGDFIFQSMFAATAATIVSGAVAERIKLGTFMIYATILVGFGYTIAGSWHWGGGWLGSLNGDAGFKDFAGSTVVHAFGGFAALAAVIVLGPRTGKYVNGKVKPILGHSMPLATIGVFLLFLGWFGFNGGSVLSANPGPLGLVFTTTTLAACAGAIAAITVAWIKFGKPDLSMALNGVLAGLVGITANADIVSPIGAIGIGAIAGIIMVFSVILFDSVLKIDDPVGAISVHGICGIWGTLACALFDTTDSGYTISGQLIGCLSVCVFAFLFSFALCHILKAIGGIRVTEEEEKMGLDVSEHGQPAYSAVDSLGSEAALKL